MIRVMIVDDSLAVCRLLQAHLESADDMKVIAVVHDGAKVLQMVKQLRPDVITLDQDMPHMGGLESLELIMTDCPTPIVMISGVSRRSAEITRKALERGAVDFILKYTPGSDPNAELLRREIVTKVRAASMLRVIRSLKTSTHLLPLPPPSALTSLSAPPPCRKGVVVIGASTGGPIALRELLESISADFPLPILIIQHIPANFTDILARQLNRSVAISVREAKQGELLQAGTALIAPGDRHLLIDTVGRIELQSGPAINGHRPAIDVTMQTAAQQFGSSTIGIVLTGMGDDGMRGLMTIQSKGGRTLAQSAETCVVNGMPQRAIDRGAVQFIGSPLAIAEELLKIVISDKMSANHSDKYIASRHL